jgi:hypothetical protein
MSIEINSVLENNNHALNKNTIHENAIEVSNVYPNDLVKHNIHASQRHLIAYLRSEAYSICRTSISPEYIRSAFNRFKNGFVYHKDKIPIAFCIWKVTEYLRFSGTFKDLYIYLICGKQLDYKLVPRMIDDVVHLCRKHNIQYITLEPANDTLKSYYIKCGFKERDTIDGSHILEMSVDNSRIMSSHKKHVVYKIKTRKRQNRFGTSK